MGHHILMADDETEIRELLRLYLEKDGYTVWEAGDGMEALALLKREKIDLAILDIMMPSPDGYRILQNIRRDSNIPVILLSAKSSDSDKILGLDLGADDYITKPFVIEELVARLKSHIRREKRGSISKSNIIKIGEICINKESYEVKKNGELITLSTKEFELLSYLMTNAGLVLSKEQIYNSVWKTEYGDIGTVAVNIKGLRKKLDPEEKYIITIWGLGYKFVKVINND